MADVKKPTTYKEQIEKLESRGLIIEDESKAIRFISNVNYYTFSGYLFDYKSKDGRYTDGLTFSKVYNIYQCDKRFKNILSYSIEIIEHSLKTKISYNYAHKLGALAYLDSSNFKDAKEHQIFIKKFNEAKDNNHNILFVKHHINKYNGKFPIWVASELFTMGMLYNFYLNIPTDLQKTIAKEYNTGANQLCSWIKCIKYLRNITAHYMRLYNFPIQVTPKKCNKNFDKEKDTTYKVFDIVYIMKFLIEDKQEWNNYIIETIDSIFEEYKEYIDVGSYGFPENWKELLKK